MTKLKLSPELSLPIEATTDSTKVRSSNPGFCFIAAGFRRVGETKKEKLVALQLRPHRMPGLPPYVPTSSSPARVGGVEA